MTPSPTDPRWRDRRIAEAFGIRHPILLSPMAGAGGVELAVAVAAGGGLAALPAAMLTPDTLAEQIAAFRARIDAPINVNFFCHRQPDPVDETAWQALLAPYYAEYHVGPPASPPPARAPFGEAMADVVDALRPEVVSCHFGLPAPHLLDRIRASGARLIASATSVAEARALDAAGVDAIIAQGFEAGGHAGRFLRGDPAAQMGLFALLPQIVDAVSVPVVAAGGIGDARGVAAALTLGAAAVQVGTAYLPTPESLIGAGHRAALTEERAECTVFTNLFSGGLARGIPDRLIADIGPVHPAAPPFPLASAGLAELRRAAEARGEVSFTPIWSGQSARLGRAEPATALTERLAAGALALLGWSA